ncbi:MAG: zinc ribbon domain-containing protein [Phycisphaerae bacterium]|nr:zinc ribbon domain-containing protein [Tepidisphaeraceae bacterium]
MITCWRCGQSVTPTATNTCPACGAVQAAQGGAVGYWTPPAADARPGWALTLIWVVLFPLAALLFPIHVMVARRRLAAHVARRMESPGLSTPAVANTPHGQAALADMARGARAGNGVLAPAALVVVVAITAILFIVPAFAPKPIRYSRAQERLTEAEPARGYFYVSSAGEYEDVWRNVSPRLTRFEVASYGSRQYASFPPTGVTEWSDGRTDTRFDHRPYRFCQRAYGQSGYWVSNVDSITAIWPVTQTMGVVFHVGLILFYLLTLLVGINYWLRLARHARAEASAATSAAVADPSFPARIGPQVSAHNGLWVGLGVIAAVTQLQLIFFPLLSALAMRYHVGWEGRSGVAWALDHAGAPVTPGEPTLSV